MRKFFIALPTVIILSGCAAVDSAKLGVSILNAGNSDPPLKLMRHEAEPPLYQPEADEPGTKKRTLSQ